ncbi:MAG TPA: glycosyltransferase [candidate division Zixibacteria bacterium]|nr:glycosyltransferase [candidate division Zixibacteria bacterium]
MLLWLSTSLFLYTWIGYPVILFAGFKLLIGRHGKKSQNQLSGDALPSVSVIIPAYNVSEKIKHKLVNTLNLNYPRDKVEVIVVSDGSTDDTVECAKSIQADNLHIYSLQNNTGKSSAQNYGITQAHNDILLFTDVGSMLDTNYLIHLISSLRDPLVACAGGKAVLSTLGDQISASQGLYWKLEQFIRQVESDLEMLHSLPGWGFAVRKSDFISLDPDTGDDMILPLDIALHGKRSVFVPEAIVNDTMPSSVTGEFKARQRITLRNLAGLMRRRALLNPFKHPRIAFAIWSHKVLRWMSPVFLILIFISSLVLFACSKNTFYSVILFTQLILYFVGMVGIMLIWINMRVPIVGFLGSFLLFNAGFLAGLIKYGMGKSITNYISYDSKIQKK